MCSVKLQHRQASARDVGILAGFPTKEGNSEVFLS